MGEGDPGEISRRSLLGLIAGGIVGALGAALGGLGLAYFAAPAFKKESEGWVDVGPAAAVKPGAPVKVDYVQRERDAWDITEHRASAWVITADGREFTVFDPRCTHLGCPYRFDVATRRFLCPCHGGVFDESGRVVAGPPPRPLDRYAVRVQSGRLLIQPLPRKAA